MARSGTRQQAAGTAWWEQPYQPPRGRRLTMICGFCEREWDAEGRQGRDVCPHCGSDADDEHVIRDERAVEGAR